MVGFAAVGAFDDVGGGLIGWVGFAAIFLHDWGFTCCVVVASIGVAGRIGHTSHSKGL